MAPLCNPVQGVDRNNLVDWCREIVAIVEALPDEALISKSISPAGRPIETYFDDFDFMTSYSDRLQNASIDSGESDRVYVLTSKIKGLEALADWNDASFLPADFHAKLGAAGLSAAYPFQKRLWRIFDQRSRIGLQWCAARSELPPWDGSAPLRHHLHWILGNCGMRLSHAATLGLENRGVVLFGRGGTGKSGTTLAGLATGLSTVGDDYIALGLEPSPLARPLFRMVKQDRAGLFRLPELADKTLSLSENWCGKVEFDPTTYFAGAIVERMPIKAVIVPNIAHAERPSIVPARAQDAMLALITSNLHQFPGEHDNGMRFFSQFLKGLPCFQLNLSIDATRNGAILREFIERLPS